MTRCCVCVFSVVIPLGARSIGHRAVEFAPSPSPPSLVSSRSQMSETERKCTDKCRLLGGVTAGLQLITTSRGLALTAGEGRGRGSVEGGRGQRRLPLGSDQSPAPRLPRKT